MILKYLALGASTAFSEELALVTAGILARAGEMEVMPAFFVCFTAIMVGNWVLWFAGYGLSGGSHWAQSRFPKMHAKLQPKIDSFAALIHGGSFWPLMILTRFIPGTRTPFFLACGFARIPFWRFTLACLGVVSVITPLLMWLAFVVGAPLLAFVREMGSYGLWGLLLTLAVVFLALRWKKTRPKNESP